MVYGPTGLPMSDAEHWLMFNGDKGARNRRKNAKREKEEQEGSETMQVARVYDLLRNGYTEIEIAVILQREFGERARPNEVYAAGLELVVSEQRRMKETLPEVVTAMRMNVLKTAINTAQVSTAAALLRDLESNIEVVEDENDLVLQVELLDHSDAADNDSHAPHRLAPSSGE